MLDCPVTPELLPIHDDLIEQKSEDAVGFPQPAGLLHPQDDDLRLLPGKDAQARQRPLTATSSATRELLRWITSYCKRYFSQQFKRSCLMDGPRSKLSPSPRAPASSSVRRREHHVPQQSGGQIKLINLLSLRS